MALGFPKPSRTVRKKAEHDAKSSRRRDELKEKAKVRRRDAVCRFPLCGCKRLGLPLEVSHETHKGMGSKDGVSTADQMVLLCSHRHRHGAISRHAGTLKARFVTPDRYDGAIAWYVDCEVIHAKLFGAGAHGERWMEVARERRPGVLESLRPDQRGMLELLADMGL